VGEGVGGDNGTWGIHEEKVVSCDSSGFNCCSCYTSIQGSMLACTASLQTGISPRAAGCCFPAHQGVVLCTEPTIFDRMLQQDQ
jgi:hypothetical protein